MRRQASSSLQTCHRAQGELRAHPQRQPGRAAAGVSPIFTQPLSVMSRLDTFRSLPGNRERPVSAGRWAQLFPDLRSPRACRQLQSPRAEPSRGETNLIGRWHPCPASAPTRSHQFAHSSSTWCSWLEGHGPGRRRRTPRSQGSAGSLPSAPSPHVPLPTTSTLLLPPVDDVVLVKVLQALEDLQDDAFHLGAENRSTNLCGSSASQANPQR